MNFFIVIFNLFVSCELFNKVIYSKIVKLEFEVKS